MIHCSQCGTPMNEGSKFCPQCGCSQQEQPTELKSHDTQSEVNGAQLSKVGFNLPKHFFRYAIPIAIVIVLGFTRPGKEAHVDAIRGELMTYLEKKAEGNSEAKMYASLGEGIVSKVLNAKLKVHSYVLFSTGEFEDGDNSKTVSIGILGKVFTFGIDEKALDRMDGKASDTSEGVDF